MNIVSKFAVASEQGIGNLLFLKEAKYRGMYEGIVKPDELAQYISQQLHYSNATNELNALGNQMIIVYVDNEPAGFAIIKQNDVYPQALKAKRILHYSFFYILPQYDNAETRNSLWQKCLSVSKGHDAIWMDVLQNDPLIPFFESCGFSIQEAALLKPFDQPSYTLIRYKDNR